MDSEEALQDADLEDLRKLLTHLVRSARFGGGLLSGKHECCQLAAILRRMRDLRESVAP